MINRLQETFQFAQADVLPYVEQYIEENSREPVTASAFHEIYEAFIAEAVPGADVVEIANDILDWVLPQITDTFFDSGRGGVVYISAPVDLCWKRLQERDRPPDKAVLHNHQQYNANDIHELVSTQDVLHLRGERPLAEKYERIHTFIEQQATH